MSLKTKSKVDLARVVGTSSWLTASTLRAKGFSLTKNVFADAIVLRYGWPLDGLLIFCSGGTPFVVNQSVVCRKEGFICRRHNEVRDLTALNP